MFLEASDCVHIEQLCADINVCFSLCLPFLTRKLFSLQFFIALCSLISKADYLITSIDSLGCFSPCASMPEFLPQFWLCICCQRQYSLSLGNFTWLKFLIINITFWVNTTDSGYWKKPKHEELNNWLISKCFFSLFLSLSMSQTFFLPLPGFFLPCFCCRLSSIIWIPLVQQQGMQED